MSNTPKQLLLHHSISKMVYDGATEPIVCPVCLVPVTEKTICITLCSHMYCKGCIVQLSACGLCRAPIKTDKKARRRKDPIGYSNGRPWSKLRWFQYRRIMCPRGLSSIVVTPVNNIEFVTDDMEDIFQRYPDLYDLIGVTVNFVDLELKIREIINKSNALLLAIIWGMLSEEDRTIVSTIPEEPTELIGLAALGNILDL